MPQGRFGNNHLHEHTMSGKLPVLISYALFGILIGLSPILLSLLPQPAIQSSHGLNRFSLRGAMLIVATLAALFAILNSAAFVGVCISISNGAAFVGACILLAFVASFRTEGGVRIPMVLGAFAGLLISATLPWWRRIEGFLPVISWNELALFILITGGALYLLTISSGPVAAHHRLVNFALLGLFLFAVALISFSTGIFHDPQAFLFAWHHWGAYVGPSEMVRSGARLFRDVPAQYGLGPTVLIAAIGGQGCWLGVYYLAGLSTLLFAPLVAGIALNLRRKSSGGFSVFVILALCLFCCFFWTSYPPHAGAPLMTPSVSGMRFLPATAMVAWLLWRDRSPAAASSGWQGAHLLWALGALWSPECAFYVTFVWWPYYLWLRCSQGSGPGGAVRLSILPRAAGKLLLSLLVVLFCFFAGYWLIYRTTPTACGYFAYVTDPPTPLPINPEGAIWFFIAVLVLGLAALYSTLRTSGNTRVFRQIFLLVLLAYATFSYFLGRSHDNNLLNLLPFQLLVLLAAFRAPIIADWARTAAAVLLASLVGWSSVFGWDVWRETISNGRLFEFNAQAMRVRFSYDDLCTAECIRREAANVSNPSDAARAANYIEGNFGEPLTVLDFAMNLRATDNGAVWSAVQGPENFVSVPSAKRQEFLVSTARWLGRNGWLVVDRKFPADEWLKDFQTAYRTERTMDFGSYYAIRFVPK
jgi:hypothetical protein